MSPAASAADLAAVPAFSGGPVQTARSAAIVAFVFLGLFFTLVSTAGVLRLPDVYSRAHTASQADTLGAGFALAAVALSLGWGSTTVKTVLLLFFIFVTNPTAAHAIARAAHEEGIEAWTVDDDRTDEDLLEEAERPDEQSVLADGTGRAPTEDSRPERTSPDRSDQDGSRPSDRDGASGGDRP